MTDWKELVFKRWNLLEKERDRGYTMKSPDSNKTLDSSCRAVRSMTVENIPQPSSQESTEKTRR